MKVIGKRRFILLFALLFLFGCRDKEKVTDTKTYAKESVEKVGKEITYNKIPDNFPSDWQSDDKMIGFYIGSKDKSGMTANYQLFCGNGRAFASGLLRHSYGGIDEDGNVRHQFILLESPDEDKIDFPASDGPDEKKQAILDYLFPDGKDCVIEYMPDYMNLGKKGAFVYKDSAFYFRAYTQDLAEFSDTIIEGLPATYLGRKSYTPKDRTCVYSRPDVTSEKIPVQNLSWQAYSKDKKVRRLYDSGTQLFDWYRGIEITVLGRTKDFYKVNGKENNWYYVEKYSNHGWVFGGDIEPWDASLTDEYKKSVIENGVKDGLIELSDVDYSSIPDDLAEITLGEDDGSAIYYNDDVIYLAYPYYCNAFAKYDRSRMAYDKDGFMKFKYGPGENDSYLFIMGGQINQRFTNFKNDGALSYRDEEDDDLMRYHSYYFKSISASSSYSETLGGRKVVYEPENLEKCFEIGCKCHPYWWNYSHIPWVEGAEGNGIGESVTVEFTEDMAGMSVLNGYTDINKLKLYKENSRLKEVQVDDLVNGDSWTVSFDDKVYFNYIAFPKMTSKIKMTIKSVYDGTKYSDTCVSAIIPSKTNPVAADSDEGKRYLEQVHEDFKDVMRDCDLVTAEELVKKLRES